MSTNDERTNNNHPNHHGYGGSVGGNINHHNNSDISQQHQDQTATPRRNLKRRCIDFHTPAIIDLTSHRLPYKSCRSSHLRDLPFLQPHPSHLRLLDLPLSTATRPIPSSAFLTNMAHVTRAKNSNPIMALSWTPGGRRLLTGNQEGEFTLWDGTDFSFELIMSAHDVSFRCMEWSHNSNYLLTADAGGNIKYWSPSIAPVRSLDSHGGQPVHGLSFSPSDTRFVSCGDDSTVRVWDWARGEEERSLEGHLWDVKCCEWHPRSSVIASGSKDHLAKLWDPRIGGTSSQLATLYGHKNTVTKVSWNNNGNWLLTASRDQLIKLYDIRTMREMASLRGHHKEVTSMAWHPLYETVFASGGMDGTLLYWNVGPGGYETPAARVPFAHDMAVWDMEWHPSGSVLATGSNDRQTKFWARNRPGSTSGPAGVDDVGVGSGSSSGNGKGSNVITGNHGSDGKLTGIEEKSTVVSPIAPITSVTPPSLPFDDDDDDEDDESSTNSSSSDDSEDGEVRSDEMELGNHVGIVIGRRGATIISMQRATGTKMRVDQVRRVLLIEGTKGRIATVKRRVGALLERVSSDFEQSRSGGGGGGEGMGHGGIGTMMSMSSGGSGGTDTSKLLLPTSTGAAGVYGPAGV